VSNHTGPGPNLSVARKLLKSGDAAAAFAALRSVCSSPSSTVEDLFAAGKVIKSYLQQFPVSATPLKVLLVGQCTVSWLGYALAAEALSRNSLIELVEGGYDQVLQDLMSYDSGERPDVVVLLPWAERRLDGGFRNDQGLADAEVAFWRQAHKLIVDRFGSRIVQIGCDYTYYGAGGAHLSGTQDGLIGRTRMVNAALREATPH